MLKVPSSLDASYHSFASIVSRLTLYNSEEFWGEIGETDQTFGSLIVR